MTIWIWALIALGAAWAFMLALGMIGAGLPVLREKIRKKRGTGK